MAHTILMPRPGQMTEECTLLVWRKQEGDRVEKGDVLFEIETDKAVMEVEAFDAGVLLRRLVAEGETVPVNSVCAYVGEPGEEIPEAASPAPSMHEAPASPLPAAPASVAGRGEGRSEDAQRQRPRMSPRARRRAAQLGIDPAALIGSGPKGRVVQRDVEAALAASASALGAAEERSGVAPRGAALDEERVPLSRMRRVIATRLTETTAVPHFTVTVAADVSQLMALRAELKSEGTPLTVTDFVVMACAQALAEMPLVNSRTDGESVWLRRRVHLGLAVSLPAGLVVPVVRDANHLTAQEIHARCAELIDAARDGTLMPDDMTGSTFTISNLGMFGVEEFSAIINPGESAILAVGSAGPTPVVVGEGITVRSVMRMTLTADHRLIDGEAAARFLDAVRRRLEDPRPLTRIEA